jgi:hypothetical protein
MLIDSICTCSKTRIENEKKDLDGVPKEEDLVN